MAETKISSHSKSQLVKLLITSVDCDPKAELPLISGHHHRLVNWNYVVDALDSAKYSFAMHRLSQPQNTKVAFLSLQAAKKVAFFYYGDDDTSTSLYEITYDESLMNDLPSDVKLKGLPQFHLFSHMPVDLQWAVAERLDGIGFARMRCVNRDLRRMWWNPRLNIVEKYSHPYMSNKKAEKEKAEKSSNSRGDGLFVRLTCKVCWAMVLYFVYQAQYNYVCEDEDDYEKRMRMI